MRVGSNKAVIVLVVGTELRKHCPANVSIVSASLAGHNNIGGLDDNDISGSDNLTIIALCHFTDGVAVDDINGVAVGPCPRTATSSWPLG